MTHTAKLNSFDVAGSFRKLRIRTAERKRTQLFRLSALLIKQPYGLIGSPFGLYVGGVLSFVTGG
jgi:hypothetical protein